MRINGKWYFNEVLNLANISQKVNFTSFNTQYTEMLISNHPMMGSDISYLRWGRSSVMPEAEVVVYYTIDGGYGYENEAYRTIDFGAAYQEVSDEFYTWLTANAKQLSKPIPMTHPKGIRLLTKGKKCTEDIEVVPTFMETVTVTFYDELGTGVTLFCTVLENGVISGKVFQVTTNAPVTVNNVIKNSVVALAVTNPFESAGEGWTAQGEYDYLNPTESYNSVGYVVKGDIFIQTSH